MNFEHLMAFILLGLKNSGCTLAALLYMGDDIPPMDNLHNSFKVHFPDYIFKRTPFGWVITQKEGATKPRGRIDVLEYKPGVEQVPTLLSISLYAMY